MTLCGRFAPSPSGRMHLGNVYSALLSWLCARKHGGRWLLRIEDIDRQRCRREYADQLLDDLLWLGLAWDDTVTYQSERTQLYVDAFRQLERQGLVYPCFCSRADILASRAPHRSDGIVVYSGRCRNMNTAQRNAMLQQRQPAWRIRVPDTTTEFTDMHYGLQTCNLAHDCGDFVIRRADGNFAYQLAVVVDDALAHVNQVVRGNDLMPSTHQQLFLYQALGFPAPQYCHLPMLLSPNGRRLSKRDRDTDMQWLRSNYSPEKLIGHIAHLCNLIDRDEPIALGELLSVFDLRRLPTNDIVVG